MIFQHEDLNNNNKKIKIHTENLQYPPICFAMKSNENNGISKHF